MKTLFYTQEDNYNAQLQRPKSYRPRLPQQLSHTSDDEFYTYYSDIEQVLEHFIPYLKDKMIFCPCDDPSLSQFIKYFQDNKEKIGYKKLLFNWLRRPLQHELGKQFPVGDFRSEESVEMLKSCDIVITNPPFSLFKELFGLITRYSKQFLLIGGLEIPIKQSIKPLYLANKLFILPYRLDNFYSFSGKKRAAARWYTNIDVGLQPKPYQFKVKMSDKLFVKRRYSQYEYIKPYDSTCIPQDYGGVVSISISYLFKINRDEFEIIDLLRSTVKGDFITCLIKKKNFLSFQ